MCARVSAAHSLNGSFKKKSFRTAIIERLARWSFDLTQTIGDAERLQHEYHDASGFTLRVLTLDAEEQSERPTALFATEEIVESIANWSQVHFFCIGGFATEDTRNESILRWIKDEVAIVLLPKKEGSSPIAFATLSPGKTTRDVIEVGRVIVKAEIRRTVGIGQSLLANLAQLVAIAERGARIFARVLAGNVAGLEMIRDVPRFVEVEWSHVSSVFAQLPKYEFGVEKFRWYVWGDIKRAREATFGRIFRELREQRGLTQQIVSQRAQLTREALNQIEHGVTPGPENLSRLIEALSTTDCLDTRARCRLLFSLGGYGLPSDLIFSETIESRYAGNGGHEARWCFSDRPVELINDEDFSRSVAALDHGLQRFFFVPRDSIASSYGIPLVKRLIQELLALELPPRHLLDRLQNIRLFVAPAALCRMRIHVLGANYSDGRFSTPRGMTIAGPNGERIDFTGSQASLFFEDVCDVIRKALVGPVKKSGRQPLGDGFELVSLLDIEPELDSMLP